MPSAFPKWLFPALALAYLLVANLALAHGSPRLGALAVTLLFAGLIASIRGRRRIALRIATVIPGAALVFGVATGKIPPLPLVLPPILIPAALAWMFGRTLLAGRTPLIQRIAHVFHAPDVPSAEMLRYMYRVTVLWTALLSCVAVVNLVLAANMTPGGLLQAAQLEAPWPVSPALFGWVSNLATYVLIGGTFVVEFVVRLIRFPNYRFRSPAAFMDRARARFPELLASFRGK
jgi:uncharacterized membrane protein